jgi:CTP:molybdopterin cytidylyltransferase MocA
LFRYLQVGVLVTHTENVAAIILAAGAGRRFGYRPKGLLQRDGQPLMARQIGLLAQAGAQSLLVVLGHHADAYLPVLQAARGHLPASARLQWVRNPDPDSDDTAASLRCGLAALAGEASTVLVALADQPLLQADDVRAVLDAWATRDPGIDLLLPTHHGQPGHPVVFGPVLRQALQLPGASVREWRKAHPERVQTLRVSHPRHTQDIDSAADLTALAAAHGVELRWPP